MQMLRTTRVHKTMTNHVYFGHIRTQEEERKQKTSRVYGDPMGLAPSRNITPDMSMGKNERIVTPERRK
jgi:hypothetical protein